MYVCVCVCVCVCLCVCVCVCVRERERERERESKKGRPSLARVNASCLKCPIQSVPLYEPSFATDDTVGVMITLLAMSSFQGVHPFDKAKLVKISLFAM